MLGTPGVDCREVPGGLLQHREVSDHIALRIRLIGHCVIHIVVVLPRKELAEYKQHLVRETYVWEGKIHCIV